MGTNPPVLEMLEIGDLAEDRFRGIFKMQYNGDAQIVLQTKVQANPLHTRHRTTPRFTSLQMLAADAPLTVPMFLRLSHFSLSGIIILVFSKQKGITLVFRNDPVEQVRVSSTFDSIPVIQRFLQKEIEAVLRNLFQEDLPAIIHKLSLQYIPQLRRKSMDGFNMRVLDSKLRVQQMATEEQQQDVTDYADFIAPLHFADSTIQILNDLHTSQLTLAPRSLALIPHSICRSSDLKRMLETQRKTQHRRRVSALARLRTLTHPGSISSSSSSSDDSEAPASVDDTRSLGLPVRPQLYHTTTGSLVGRNVLHRRKIKRTVVRLTEGKKQQPQDYFNYPTKPLSQLKI